MSLIVDEEFNSDVCRMLKSSTSTFGYRGAVSAEDCDMPMLVIASISCSKYYLYVLDSVICWKETALWPSLSIFVTMGDGMGCRVSSEGSTYFRLCVLLVSSVANGALAGGACRNTPMLPDMESEWHIATIVGWNQTRMF